MVSQIYLTEHTKAPFLDLDMALTHGIVSSKMYNTFNFEIVSYPFLDGDVARSPSYGVHEVYISQLIRFVGV